MTSRSPKGYQGNSSAASTEDDVYDSKLSSSLEISYGDEEGAFIYNSQEAPTSLTIRCIQILFITIIAATARLLVFFLQRTRND